MAIWDKYPKLVFKNMIKFREGNFSMFSKTNEGYLSQIALKEHAING